MDRFIRTNGLQLHYLEHSGDGPLIVLLPGLTANAHAFDGLVQAGLSPRFHALALDLRGRGLSDAPADGYTMADHAADVIGLLDALGIAQATLAGHSFGGLLTYYLAAQYPARVTRLIVLDAAMSNATPATRAAIQPSLDRLGRVLPAWETYLDAIKRAPYFDGWWDPAIESYFRADVRINADGSIQPRSRPEVIGAAMDGVIAEDWQAHLALIRQPALLFQAPGAYGPPGTPPILSAEQARATIERLADCRFVEVPGNHMTMLYGAGARRIVDEITTFLRDENDRLHSPNSLQRSKSTMSSIPTLPGITSQMIETPRLRMHALFSGPADGVAVLFIHGNASSSTFWEETMLALPGNFRGIAVDLRGYGDTEDELIDATRGYGDWVDDLIGFTRGLGLERYHVVGHSMGGALLFSLLPAAGASILSATLVAPGSPYGFGGTKDLVGTPCYADFAGSGGGTVNPEFTRLIGAQDRGDDNPQASPRVVMNTFYWKPPFRSAREEALLSSLLSEKVGSDKYPGDFVASPNWPGVMPGVLGPVNAMSPKYVGDSVRRFVAAAHKPQVLWVRGANDQIVSDSSLFEFGTLGKLGAVPGWPGEEVYPPQPMVGQTRAVLDQYAAVGGTYREAVIDDCGHSPYIERPGDFLALLLEHLAQRSA